MEREAIETKSAKIWLSEDGIIYQKIFSSATLTLDNVKENFEISKKIGEKYNLKKLLILSDVGQVKSIDRKGREYSSSIKVAKHVLANAILVNSPLSRTLGRIYLGINKPLYPTLLFTSEDKALKWLKGNDEKNKEENDQ